MNYCYVKFHHDCVLQGDENFHWYLLFKSDGYRMPISESLALEYI